jgi:hypothetical protein
MNPRPARCSAYPRTVYPIEYTLYGIGAPAGEQLGEYGRC